MKQLLPLFDGVLPRIPGFSPPVNVHETITDMLLQIVTPVIDSWWSTPPVKTGGLYISYLGKSVLDWHCHKKHKPMFDAIKEVVTEHLMVGQMEALGKVATISVGWSEGQSPHFEEVAVGNSLIYISLYQQRDYILRLIPHTLEYEAGVRVKLNQAYAMQGEALQKWMHASATTFPKVGIRVTFTGAHDMEDLPEVNQESLLQLQKESELRLQKLMALEVSGKMTKVVLTSDDPITSSSSSSTSTSISSSASSSSSPSSSSSSTSTSSSTSSISSTSSFLPVTSAATSTLISPALRPRPDPSSRSSSEAPSPAPSTHSLDLLTDVATASVSNDESESEIELSEEPTSSQSSNEVRELKAGLDDDVRDQEDLLVKLRQAMSKQNYWHPSADCYTSKKQRNAVGKDLANMDIFNMTETKQGCREPKPYPRQNLQKLQGGRVYMEAPAAHEAAEKCWSLSKTYSHALMPWGHTEDLNNYIKKIVVHFNSEGYRTHPFPALGSSSAVDRTEENERLQKLVLNVGTDTISTPDKKINQTDKTTAHFLRSLLDTAADKLTQAQKMALKWEDSKVIWDMSILFSSTNTVDHVDEVSGDGPGHIIVNLVFSCDGWLIFTVLLYHCVYIIRFHYTLIEM